MDPGEIAMSFEARFALLSGYVIGLVVGYVIWG